jgi:GTP-binding protein HflX
MMNYPLQQKKYFKIITNVKSWIGHIYPYFAQRAETSYARTQVELASANICYLDFLECGLTSSVKRGIGMRGPGETEIETDRRIVRDRISLLKIKLKPLISKWETAR